ncbi:MAG TPA: CHAD domain-containing protein [Solirubrobacter sp.]|nr:CHAD domain-containing protein [Solirubrobacter sp.]
MEYLLPAGVELGAHLDVRAGRARTGTVTFYDTFDGRLHAAGVSLRHAHGRLALLDRASGDALGTAEAPRAARLLVADLPPALRARLEPAIEMRALMPVARVRVRQRPIAVLNEDAKTVLRLTVERPDGLAPRVTATPVRGYEAELERLEELLEAADVPLVDEAVLAAGGRPEGTSSKLALTLDPDAPANQAAADVFDRLLEVFADNLPGTLDDVDTEFLHDLRVAVRRTRSLQRQFKTIYPPRLQHFRDEFKRLQQATGDLRDLDVHLLDFDALRGSLPEPMRPDLEPLRALLEQRRGRAFRAARRTLNSQRTHEALEQWAAFVHAAPTTPRSVRSLASRRIARVYRKMIRMGDEIGDDSPAEDLHELRKVGKELRYLLEFFSSLYAPEVVKPLVKTLKGLQDVLGRFQDREVQGHTLRALADEVREPGTILAMGALVARFNDDEAAARADFAGRFAAFAAAKPTVKEHFG